MDGESRLASIMAALPPADAAWLAEHLGVPQWKARRNRLDGRDEAVRAAFAVLAPMRPVPAAKRLAAALDAYLAAVWLADRERGHAGADPFRQALFGIAQANGGRPIGARQLRNVILGARTPAGK